MQTLLLLILVNICFASHFRGGTITWKPISDNGATVTVEFHAFWAWRRSFTSTTCNLKKEKLSISIISLIL